MKSSHRDCKTFCNRKGYKSSWQKIGQGKSMLIDMRRSNLSNSQRGRYERCKDEIQFLRKNWTTNTESVVTYWKGLPSTPSLTKLTLRKQFTSSCHRAFLVACEKWTSSPVFPTLSLSNRICSPTTSDQLSNTSKTNKFTAKTQTLPPEQTQKSSDLRWNFWFTKKIRLAPSTEQAGGDENMEGFVRDWKNWGNWRELWWGWIDERGSWCKQELMSWSWSEKGARGNYGGTVADSGVGRPCGMPRPWPPTKR